MPPYKWFPQHTFSRMIYTWDHIKVTVARGHLASREEGRMVLLAVPARDREVQQREDHSTWKTRVGTICIDLDGPSSQHLWVPSTFATAKLWSAFKSFFKNKLRKIEKLHPGKGKQLKRVPFIFQTTSFFGFHANFSREYFRFKTFSNPTVDARGTALAIAGKIQAGAAAERSREWLEASYFDIFWFD